MTDHSSLPEGADRTPAAGEPPLAPSPPESPPLESPPLEPPTSAAFASAPAARAPSVPEPLPVLIYGHDQDVTLLLAPEITVVPPRAQLYETRIGASHLAAQLRKHKHDLNVFGLTCRPLAPNEAILWELDASPAVVSADGSTRIQAVTIVRDRYVELGKPPRPTHFLAAPESEDAFGKAAVIYILADLSLDVLPPAPRKGDACQAVLLQLWASQAEKINHQMLTALIDEIRSLDVTFVVICNAWVLAFGGNDVSEESSWEAFVEQATAALSRNAHAGPASAADPAQKQRTIADIIAAADIVVCRCKEYAAGIFQLVGESFQRRVEVSSLVYYVDPYHATVVRRGRLIGYNSLVGASILAAILNPSGPPVARVGATLMAVPCVAAPERVTGDLFRQILFGAMLGIERSALFASRGYNVGERPAAPSMAFSPSAAPPKREGPWFNESWLSELLDKDGEGKVDVVNLKGDKNRSAVPRGWSVLTKIVKERVTPSTNQVSVALEIGAEIVSQGIKSAVNSYGIPIFRIGKLTVVDRRSFEEYWEVQASIRSYLGALARETMPLSIAVFGAPGGGKGFGVKQVAIAMKDERLHPEPVELNMTQISTWEEIARVFREVRDISLSNKVPLVFFDEFDSPRDQLPFGWLKSFLAPMQDGVFWEGREKIKVSKAIFVFIGGISHSFETFHDRVRNREFIQAKGPDFVSRLAKHLNVRGIHIEEGNVPPGIIRRAVVVRDLFEKYHPYLIGADESARIAPDVVRRFLSVPAYKHGIRSLESIIRSTRPSPGNSWIGRSSLPPEEQLEMHVPISVFFGADD